VCDGLVVRIDLTSFPEFQLGTNRLAVHFSKLLEAMEAPNMKIRPLYDRVVIKRVEDKETTTHGGLYIPDSAKEKPQEGEVVAIGKGKRLEDGKIVALDVQVGDRILFAKYSGNDIKLDGEEYMIMREDEILGILDKQPVAAKKAS
jgi:chaperonin GroES